MSRARGPRHIAGTLRRLRRGARATVRILVPAGLCAAAVHLMFGIDPSHGAGAARHPAASRWTWNLPRGFPIPKVPAGNPMTKEKVELGRFLFYDRRLSGNGTQSCGGCHIQSLAFTDGLVTAVGSTGETHPRNTQSLANVVYNPTLTWANPSLVTLERQMEVPLFGEHPVEMGVNDRNRSRVLARLRRDGRYRRMYADAFPGSRTSITWANTVRSIATFQRTIISGGSRYDGYLAGSARLTSSETRGMNLFFGERAECHHCHTGFNLNDQVVSARTRVVETPFHNTGLYNVGGTGAFPEPNRGVFELTGRPRDMGAFRAPSLRNVAVTAPYMHDGSVATLEDVVDIYAAGGRNVTQGPFAGDGRDNPFKDPLIAPIALDDQDRADLVAFLRTLTDRRLLTDPRLSDPFRRG